MTASRRAAFPAFLAGVAVAGLGVFLTALAVRLPAAVGEVDGAFVVLALLLVAAELRPLDVVRDGSRDAVSLSAAFAVALVLQYDVALVVGVQALASVADDVRHRTAWWTALFNVSQYTLSLAAAAAVVMSGGGVGESLETGDLPLVAAACVAFFAMNTVLPGLAYALQAGVPILRSLLEDLPFQLSVNGVVVLMAPLVVATADDSLWLVGLLLVPTYAVYRGALAALDRAHLATHDRLTGLPNQASFAARLAELVEADADQQHVGVLAVGLDHFTDVAHTLGSEAGDDLLQQVAHRLRTAVPEGAVLARADAGGFLVAVPGLASPWAASSCAEALLSQFGDPYSLADSAFALRASVGLTVAPLHGREAEPLVQHAQLASELAQRARSGLEVYSADRDQFTGRRLAVLSGLRPGLRRREMTVVFQPQVDLVGERVCGYEALLRWQHPELGTVPPDELVALAEHAGMMREITEFVLDEALRQLAAWRQQGREVTVSVNVSASVLQDAELPARVARRLALWGVPSTALVLELTETAVMSDPERCQAVMQELRRLQVGLSLDDYGTGWASLSYLTTLPVDEIKIDKSFVLAMTDSRTDRAVVRSTLELAQELGLRVVAEGVETGELAGLLMTYGCRTAQGYHYGRPVPAQDVVVDLTGVPTRIPSTGP